MNIYVMRHGQTDWNKILKIQGRTDNPLNETGRQQARDKAKLIEYIKPDLLVHSSLMRTKETLNEVSSVLNWQNIKTIVSDDFIERDFGALDSCHVDEYYNCPNYDEVNGYETDDMITSRVHNGLISLAKLENTNTIFIVAHSHVLKSIYNILGAQNPYQKKLDNCLIMNLEVSKDDIKLIELI